MSTYTRKISPGEIARAECILADGAESIQAAKKRTGADIIINWPIYEFDSRVINSRFVVFGQRHGNYPSWGIAFPANGAPYWDYDGQGGAACFAGAYSNLVIDGAVRDGLGDKARRGRTAMGLTASGELVIYVCQDGSGDACTTAQLAQRMLALGCIQAANGDGGGSSQILAPGCQIITGRPVAAFVGIWLKKEEEKPKEENKLKSIYLSPSTQEKNTGAGSYGTEERRMNQLADLLENELRGKYILYRNRPEWSLQQVVADSNQKRPDIHLALHSNAGGARGCEVMICGKGGQAEKLAQAIYKEMEPLTPTSDRGVKVDAGLYEPRETKAPAALVEVEFHDSAAGAAWIVGNLGAIAKAIAKGVNGFFGVATPEAPKTELQQAIDLGITDGTRPNEPATRAESAVMALRAAKAVK